MSSWLNEASLGALCAVVLCFALAWRSPVLGAALAAGAAASLWAQPASSPVLGAFILLAVVLGLGVFAPRLRASTAALVASGADSLRARWRRPSARARLVARVGRMSGALARK